MTTATSTIERTNCAYSPSLPTPLKRGVPEEDENEDSIPHTHLLFNLLLEHLSKFLASFFSRPLN